MNNEAHEALVDTLLGIQGKAILSGYANPLYAPLEAAGWERRNYEQALSSAVARSGVARDRRMECLWLSPQVVETGQQAITLFSSG